jgi:hypothetical protein
VTVARRRKGRRLVIPEQKALELIRRFNDPGREHAQQSPQRWRSRLEGRLYV